MEFVSLISVFKSKGVAFLVLKYNAVTVGMDCGHRSLHILEP